MIGASIKASGEPGVGACMTVALPLGGEAEGQ